MFELRQYQTEAIDLCHQRIEEGHRPIICAPTGSGKTVIAGSMAKDYMDAGKRVLFLSGRREILRQSYDTFVEFCGRTKVGFLMAGESPYWFYPPVTVASWDTLKARWDKAETWRVPADVIMYDEAHLALSNKMVRTIIPHYAEAINIGLTATPAKQSGKGLGSHFTRIIQVRSVQQIIDEGFLAACEYWGGSHADVSKIHTKNGDFVQKELAAAHRDNVLVGDVVDNWLRLAADRHTIVFAVDIQHAEALTQKFQSAGIRAETLHSKLTQDTRGRISDSFKRREVQVLVNVGIATYGYDVPSVNCVVLARPTKSIVLHLQMIGRGMRPKPDGDYCMVLDHAGNVDRLGCAEDEMRWTLDESKQAATNWRRLQAERKGGEERLTQCGNCFHMFGQSRVCPKCGWEKPVAARDVHVVDGELVRRRKAKADQAEREGWPSDSHFYLMLRGHAMTKGYKPGWSYFKFKERCGYPPTKSWNTLPPMQPNPRVAAWIKSQQIRFAKRRRA